MKVDADIPSSVDLLGKTAEDLQSDIAIRGNNITGTLKYVTDYTGFSGDVEEQSGNYLALHFDVADVEDATITVEIIGGTHGPVTLDPDGLIIMRIKNNDQTIKVTASKEGIKSFTRIFSIRDLVLTEA